MSKAKEENKQAIVLDFADQVVIAHTAFPDFTKARTGQRVPDAVRIVQPGYAIMEEFQDGLAVLGVENGEFPINPGRQLNSVGHDVS
jgi:hypothetical protein